MNITENGENFAETYAQVNGNITKDSYMDVTTCIRTYLNAINLNNTTYYGYDEDGKYTNIISENEIKQIIYNLLSENYISKNNITIDNLYSHIKTLDEQVLFVPLDISLIKDSDNIKSFIIYGITETLTDLSMNGKIFAIVNISFEDKIFSVEPIYGDYNNISEINLKEYENTITKNDNNFITQTTSNYEDIVKEYMNLYKRLAIGYPEKMYDLLDEEYRAKRFGSLEEFKNYIEKNKRKIIGLRVEQYNVTYNDEYTQYICIDQYENYYIFREKAVLDYSVILDTYTIDLPEFIEKYESATAQEKVALNLEKVIEAINEQDYKYVYNKLNETFKKNNFSTLEKFETYMKENFYEENEASYLSFNEISETYTYSVKIKDTESKKYKTKNFVMKLGEGTEFEMSFGI